MALVSGNWYHIAVVRDGISLKAYVDAVLTAEGSNVALGNVDLGGGPVPVIGVHGGDLASFNVGGLVDDVQIFDRALSAGEVSTIMSGGTVSTVAYEVSLLSRADINNDDAVNFKDYAALTIRWLDTELWPAP